MGSGMSCHKGCGDGDYDAVIVTIFGLIREELLFNSVARQTGLQRIGIVEAPLIVFPPEE